MRHKPLIFIDLDDTVFQTHRKQQPTEQYRIATTDKSGQPLSYMNQKQQFFMQWLLQSADIVPVTARSVEGFKRVQLPFVKGAICSHGGTILNSDFTIDSEWVERQHQSDLEIKDLFHDLPDALHDYARDLGTVRTWSLIENDLTIYAVAKQTEHSPLFLEQLIEKLPSKLLQHCYVHINGNNLAIIPNHISKKNAVEFYIKKHVNHPDIPILGWGDSLSDLGFLNCCDWFGMPKNSQLDKFLNLHLSQDFVTKGYLGHV